MCGICGSTCDPGLAAVSAMNAAMIHRGPDDEGTYLDPEAGVALGARRLSIIDVQGGHQPLSNEDRTVWAVLNGEIYNHPALRERLRDRGHRLATATDTEVLVHLYEDYGDALVHALEGMFAFALWDARRGRLLLGRDRFGEKPLFYRARDGELLFASELDTLAAAAPPGHEPDPAAVDAFFVLGYVPGPGSILQGLRQLPPGHLLTWERSAGSSPPRPYWEPPLPVTAPSADPRELAAEATALLESSVRSRMIADVPLGVFLSGGVDSTLIAALAARTSTRPIQTFTVGYDVGAVSETEPARAIAREIGADHHELLLTQADVATRVPALLARMDQPLADPALAALHAVAGLAREQVTVAVGGEGADELFGGYPRYRWLERAERLDRAIPAPVARASADVLRRAPLNGRAGRLADVVDRRQQLERHIDWVSGGRRHLRPLVYGPALRAALAAGPPDLGLERHLVGPGEAPEAGRFMRLDLLRWLPDDVLAKADRAGMLVSLEIRTPYLHRELAELAAAAPPGLHLAHRGKALLRAALREVLPAGRRRPKTAFRVPVRDWLRGPLSPTLAAQLERGSVYAEGWLDRRAMARMTREHLEGRRDWSHSLWPALALGLWLDRLRGVDARR